MGEQGDTGQQGEVSQQEATPQQPAGGVEHQKLWAVLGYIISILFFVPLLSEETKNRKFSRFHANQQLVLLLVWIVGAFLMPFFGLGMLVYLFALVLAIMGIVNASGGKMKKLPLVGGITLIK